jgi:GNAT superfamily N-acetyltransferase
VTAEPRDIAASQPPMFRNTPMQPRAWRELLVNDDVAAIESDAGALLLTLDEGQLNLHYGFADLEEMRLSFIPMFDELKDEIDSFDADYVRIDLVQVPDRTWTEPLLYQTDFKEFGEWMDMVNAELDPEMPPPEFPSDVTMRRATPGDVEAIVELESDAYGTFSDGEAATLARLEAAGWVGVLEQDGEIIAYAANAEVERGVGRVVSCGVHPEDRGNGYGKLILQAATYQLVANDARRASVRVRPELPASLRVTQAVGYRPDLRGIEWRRHADEDEVAADRLALRLNGVKARFGDWR